ncbi:MAG TPA: hypothetical protein VGM92_07060 [Candidatus Kapabacteria bacterium]
MSRSYQKIAAIALAFIFILGTTPTAFAQDTGGKDYPMPITTAGSAALMFELGGLGTFNFSGLMVGPLNSAVGARYFISDGTDLFALLGLNSTSGIDTGFGPYSASSAKPSETKFGIGVGAQMHFRHLYSTSPYVGAIISFGSDSYDDGETGTSDQKHSTSTFGVAAMAGFDWYFTNGLALGGEASLGFTSKSASETVEGSTTTGNGSSVIALSTGASVHLVVNI